MFSLALSLSLSSAVEAALDFPTVADGEMQNLRLTARGGGSQGSANERMLKKKKKTEKHS